MNYFKTYSKHYTSILRLGLPLLLGQLGMIVTGYADTIMVGNYSTEALASSAFVNNALVFVIMLGLGFSYGLTPMIGSLYSKNDTKRMGELVRNGVIVNFLYTLAWCVPMLILYFNIHNLGLPENLLPTIRPYYLLIFFSVIPLGIVNALRQFTDAINDTKVSMYILLAGNILNIIFNYLLIYGKCGMPELGLNGAGISTLMSRVFMLVAYAVYVFFAPRYSHYRKAIVSGSTSGQDMRSITATSLPISLQLGMETAIFTIASVFAGWLGESTMAAVQIVNTIAQIGFMIYYSLGAAASIKMSNHYGIHDYVGVKQIAHAAYMLTLASVVLACSIFIIFGEQMAGLFTRDAAVVALVTAHMLHLTLYQIGDATQIAYANALRGIAHVKPILKYAFISYIVVGIPLMYVLCFTLNLRMAGIYYAYFFALLGAGLLFSHAFFRRMASLTADGAAHTTEI